jgi:hypothetical protein
MRLKSTKLIWEALHWSASCACEAPSSFGKPDSGLQAVLAKHQAHLGSPTLVCKLCLHIAKRAAVFGGFKLRSQIAKPEAVPESIQPVADT